MDLYPYSGTRSGAVNDSEHEALWGGIPDGLLPGQASNALAVSVGGGNWTVQPGRFRIAGHVLDVDTAQTGPLPGGATATRTSVITAFVDRTQSPWTYGIRIVLGTPGAGRPALSQSATAVYEVALRSFTTATNGATTLGDDERPYAAGMPWQTYTPLWTNVGSNVFSVRTGRWRRIAPKHVIGRIYVAMSVDGTGSGTVTTSLPTEPARGIRHAFHGHAEGPAAILEAVCFAGGSGKTVERILEVNSAVTQNLTTDRCTAGRLFTLAFDYEEA